MIPCLSQVCTLNSSFEDDVKDYSAGAARSLEIWLGKLETYLASHSLDDVRQLFATHEVTAPVASFQGGLLVSQGEARREHWDHFSRRLELCQALAINTLIVAADVQGPLNEADFGRIQASLVDAAKRAGDRGIRLALEFQSQSTFINNLQTAVALISECGSPHLGICLDLFHFSVGPSKTEDLGYLSPENLFHVQLSDLSGLAREMATDADRILPGDGDLPLEPVVDYLRSIRYTGSVSVELMNPQIWRIPARQFSEVAMTALRKVLGLASMG